MHKWALWCQEFPVSWKIPGMCQTAVTVTSINWPSSSLVLTLFRWSLRQQMEEMRLGNSAVNEGERSASCPTCFTHKEEDPSTHWIVQVGPKTSLGAFEKRKMKISCHARNAVNFYHTALFVLLFFISLINELQYSCTILKCEWNTVIKRDSNRTLTPKKQHP